MSDSVVELDDDDLDLEDLKDLQDEAPAPPVELIPRDPAALGYPPMLPLEIALHERPVRDVCASYGINIDRWRELCQDDVFKADLEARVIELRQDGMSFKLKARLQSEELLKTSWRIIHDPKTPFAVRADLIKHTVRVAGYDASKEQGLGAVGAIGAALKITINLGDGT